MLDRDRTRWNAKYKAGSHDDDLPSAVLLKLADQLPTRGRALDIAGGAGSEAVWLAQRGLTVTLIDVSDVALKLATERAQRNGVSLETHRIDLESQPVPTGPWDLVTCCSYLQRDVWNNVVLAPGGTLVWIHPTVANLERNARPSARFLLEPGEGHAIIGAIPTLTVFHHQESWISGRHLSVVMASAGN
ncbi:MAG: class I SAM-dependent methyltransferase [Nannocystaceae bacterium]|nr:class I SAM-dependent methyltransferase [Nannocystaceae bacterium]